MLAKLGQRNLWKLGVYFLYLCGQVLILGALMLTSKSIITHTILMILTICLYFAVCLKDPGSHRAHPEPNLDDISNQVDRIPPLSSKNKKTKSDQGIENNLHGIIEEKQEQSVREKRSKVKKVSIEQRQLKVDPSGEVGINIQEKQEQQENQKPEKENNNKIQSTKNIVMNAFVNFTNFISLSRKNIQTSIEQQKSVIKQKSLKMDQQAQKQIQQQPPILQILKRSQKMQQPQQSHQRAKIPQKQKRLVSTSKQNISEIQRIKNQKRYCRICQFYQPLRVRHCHSCEECIATFDHHCPWLATCIGQKNKLAFLCYLFAQTIQFLAILIDLLIFITTSKDMLTPKEQKASVGILLLAISLVFIILVLLLSFHIYLALNNLTTWELFRWQRIEYLAPFDKNSIKSPFSQGWRQNIHELWTISFQIDNKDWQGLLTNFHQKYLKTHMKHTNKNVEKNNGGTQRKMYLSERVI